jgi:hypothetical protein
MTSDCDHDFDNDYDHEYDRDRCRYRDCDPFLARFYVHEYALAESIYKSARVH